MKHLACIMDGNRRWAKKHGWLPWDGHRAGVKAAKRVIQFCIAQRIEWLSLYTFSLENFKRSADELSFLFNVIPQEFERELDDLIQRDVRIRFIGDRALFPEKLKDVCERLEQKTENNTGLNLNMCFCYGARQELVHSMKSMLNKIKKGINLSINEETIQEHLWTGNTPAPDVIVRTGGAKRLSNFLLFQSAYSELYFIDTLWPDICDSQLHEAVNFYNQCQRNFGV